MSMMRRWADRITYVIAEAQLLVAGVLVSAAILLMWVQPSIPGVPPWAMGVFAALTAFGPMLFVGFLVGLRKLRNRHRVTVHHINGVTDTREKYYVDPEIWSEKDVDGPSPYSINDGDAFEVREFDYTEETGTLTVTGTYMSALADSKLVTCKTMLEDVHGDLIDGYRQLKRHRARISKIGIEIEGDVIAAHAEADERGLTMEQTGITSRYEEAGDEIEEEIDEIEIEDMDAYTEDYSATERPTSMDVRIGDAETSVATDGGEDHG